MIPQKLNNSTTMQNNDQIAIFESYRDEILSKFKKSLEGEEGRENEIEKTEEPSSEVESDDSEIPEIDVDDSEVEDIEDVEPPKKKNVIIRSQEVATKLDPELRELVRHMPEVIEDVEVFSAIKAAIREVNDDALDLESKIFDTPLSIYDKLIASGVYSEEEVMEDDERLSFKSEEDLDDDAFTLDDYSDDDDLSGEREFDLSKKTRGEREDLKSGIRKDIERSRAEEILRQMGVDFEDRRGFSDDDY